jgi:hypothetical protein
MSLLRAHPAGGFVLFTILTACGDGASSVAPTARSAGAQTPAFAVVKTQSEVLARARFDDPHDPVLKVTRRADDWRMEVMAKPGFDLAVQRITFPPGAQSGWHRHPGPVFILVKSGEVTFYESTDPTCTGVVRKAGEGFLDAGDHAHIAINRGDVAAENIVTYFVPPGALSLRSDAADPGNCPF